MLKINIDNISKFVTSEELDFWKPKAADANKMIYGTTGKGTDFLGWVDLPSRISDDEIKAIEDRAVGLAEISDIIIVIGIGGSYLGARAVIDALSDNFNSLLTKQERKA